jgi:hypothetical protein
VKVLSLVASLICLTFCAVQAQEARTVAEVGRAVLTLPDGNWQLVAVEDSSNPLEGNVALPTQNKAYALKKSNGEIQAFLLLNASKGGTSVTTNWTNTCEAKATTYAQAGTERLNTLSCARATVPLKTSVYLPIAAAYAAKQVDVSTLPNVVASISAIVGNANGTMLYVNLLVPPEFSGLNEIPRGSTPARVNPKHAAWADLLLKNIEESISTLSGKATIPPQGFQ